MGIFAFLLSPVGRWIAGTLSVLSLACMIYTKGRLDGRASYKAKIEREISQAIQKGEKGRADALQKLHDNDIPDSWFRD